MQCSADIARLLEASFSFVAHWRFLRWGLDWYLYPEPQAYPQAVEVPKSIHFWGIHADCHPLNVVHACMAKSVEMILPLPHRSPTSQVNMGCTNKTEALRVLLGWFELCIWDCPRTQCATTNAACCQVIMIHLATRKSLLTRVLKCWPEWWHDDE